MIILKSADEIERMRIAGRVLAEVLNKLKEIIQPGITTMELEKVAEREILRNGGEPTFKGYKRFANDFPFPSCICVSINDEIVHGMPSKRKLQSGDIVSIDVGIKVGGFCSDSAVTVPVNGIDKISAKLLKTTEEALYKGIGKACKGNRLQDISYSIQEFVGREGFSVVRDFVGHGIGRLPHEDPQVPNFGKPGCGRRLEEGMVIAIEPMVNVGSYKVAILENSWTAVTADHNLSAHFEHTVAITKKGPEILSILN